jgi:hypothetical protein
VRSELPLTIALAQVASAGCTTGKPIELANDGFMAIGVANVETEQRLVVAHGFGHVLGLDDDNNCYARGEKHLMCSDTVNQAPVIRPFECERARRAAAEYERLVWPR